MKPGILSNKPTHYLLDYGDSPTAFDLCQYQWRYIRHCHEATFCRIVLRRYTEDSILLVVTTESVPDPIGQAHNIIDVTTLDIILLLNGFDVPIFARNLLRGNHQKNTGI